MSLILNIFFPEFLTETRIPELKCGAPVVVKNCDNFDIFIATTRGK
jgi:hypothetical protein